MTWKNGLGHQWVAFGRSKHAIMAWTSLQSLNKWLGNSVMANRLQFLQLKHFTHRFRSAGNLYNPIWYGWKIHCHGSPADSAAVGAPCDLPSHEYPVYLITGPVLCRMAPVHQNQKLLNFLYRVRIGWEFSWQCDLHGHLHPTQDESL